MQDFKNNPNYNTVINPNPNNLSHNLDSLSQRQNSNIASSASGIAKIPRTTKPFKVNLHWVLTTFLIFYSLFSFIWLGVLYSGIDGQRICTDQNFVCDIKFPYTKQAAVAVEEFTRVSGQASRQKLAKNYIRNIWQEQSVLNDDLVSKQQDVEKSILDYKNYLQNYIRFLNGTPELLSGFEQQQYVEKLTTMEEEIQNLRQIRNSNAEKKSESKTQVDQIYKELEERQENTFKDNR